MAVATIFASSAATTDLDPRHDGFASTSRNVLRGNYGYIDSVIISFQQDLGCALDGSM